MKKIFTKLSFWFLLTCLVFIALLVCRFLFKYDSQSYSDIFDILLQLTIGFIVSFIFYFIIVFIPEKRKNVLLKSNLRKQYKHTKEQVLWHIMSASAEGGREDISTDFKTHETLMTIEGFRKCFDGGKERYEGFDAFINKMEDEDSWSAYTKDIIHEYNLFAIQIEYILAHYPIKEEEVFDRFHNLNLQIHSFKNLRSCTDDYKILSRFICGIYTGSSFTKGRVEYDEIEKTIENL